MKGMKRKRRKRFKNTILKAITGSAYMTLFVMGASYPETQSGWILWGVSLGASLTWILLFSAANGLISRLPRY